MRISKQQFEEWMEKNWNICWAHRLQMHLNFPPRHTSVPTWLHYTPIMMFIRLVIKDPFTWIFASKDLNAFRLMLRLGSVLWKAKASDAWIETTQRRSCECLFYAKLQKHVFLVYRWSWAGRERESRNHGFAKAEVIYKSFSLDLLDVCVALRCILCETSPHRTISNRWNIKRAIVQHSFGCSSREVS